MSSSRLAAGFVVSFVLVSGSGQAIAADAHSSPEDRARFVAITHKLEADPFEPGARDDRTWALSWLTAAPDVTVKVCFPPAGDDLKGYPYAGELTIQDVFAMAAFVIEHPDAANDLNAQQTAGLTGALNAYRVVAKVKPDGKSAALDSLLDVQAKGGLADFVRKDREAHCSGQK
jgi:hypothetical protein